LVAQIMVQDRFSAANGRIFGRIVDNGGATVTFATGPNSGFSTGTIDLMVPFAFDIEKTASLTRRGFTLTPTVSVHHQDQITQAGESLTITAHSLVEVETMTGGSTDQLDWAANESSAQSSIFLDLQLETPTEVTLTGSLSVDPVEGASSAESVHASFSFVGLTPGGINFQLRQTGAQLQTMNVSTIFEPGDYLLIAQSGVLLDVDDRVLTGGKAMFDFLLRLNPLEVNEYRWTNASGGNWDTPQNWDNGGPPGAENTALFNLGGAYSVTFPGNVQNDQLIITAGNVTFDLASHTYDITGPGGGGPDGRLQVWGIAGASTHLTITNGEIVPDSSLFLARQGQSAISLIDGGRLTPSGAVTMAIQAGSKADIVISGASSRLRSWNVAVADGGRGTIFVENGGALEAGHLTIGSESTANGQLTVTGNGSRLEVLPVGGSGDGILIVGVEGPGSAALLGGAHAVSNRVYLGLPDLGIPVPVPIVDPDPLHPDASRGSAVIGGPGTEWRNVELFQVGGVASADLLVDSGALLDTGRFEIFGNPTIQASAPVSTATFSGPQTRLKVTNELTAGGNSSLTFEQGAQFTAGLLSLHDGTTVLTGGGTSGQVNGTQTAVQVFRGGTLVIEDGAILDSSSVRHIIGAGTVASNAALVRIAGAGSSWDMGLTDLLIAINQFGVDGGDGELRLENGAHIRAHDILVGTGGRITGSDSTIDANVNLLGGTISPGLSPGSLTIEGNFTQGPLGALEVEIAGLDSGGEFDQLIVTGDAKIEGTIQLKFLNGFAPQQGQQFEFLDVGGATTLTSADFETQNLAPGFEFDIAPSANGISMTALNDGVFLQPVTWNVDADGDWSAAENWSEGDPNVSGVSASFLGAITAPRTINIDAAKAVASLAFDNEHSYTLAGPGPLQFDNRGYTSVQADTGEHTISAPLSIAENTTLTKRGAGTLTISGVQSHGTGAVLVANGGVMNLNSDGGTNLSVQSNAQLNFGATQHLAGVTIGDGGRATLTSGGTKNLVAGALSIAGGDTPTGTLDLTDNAAIIDYAGTSPAATVRNQILAGRGAAGFGATWTGSGITSSIAAVQVADNPESVSIAYAVNRDLPLGPYTTFGGEAVDESTVLILYTRTADANLDGVVNDDDVTILGAAYAPGVPNANWAVGDFDYNGFVDDDDVTLLGAFYDPAAPPISAPQAVRADVAAIPEPRTVVLVLLGAIAVAFGTTLCKTGA
jgi:T5SS/PEP-CTERM-associated repeat protein